jgi:hypothetical protein
MGVKSSDNNDFLAILQAIIPLQTATKAIYYYSVGLPSLAAQLTGVMRETDQSIGEHRELMRVVDQLHQRSSSSKDSGRKDAPALQANNPTQRPYSEILAVVESGDVSPTAVRAIVELFNRNGFK